MEYVPLFLVSQGRSAQSDDTRARLIVSSEGKRMTNSDPNDLLTLLLHESAQVRDDERYMANQQAVVIGSAITLVLGMAVFFYTTCPVGVLPNTKYCPHTKDFIAIPIWLYISAMILPIGLLGYAVTMSTTMALRSYYMRVPDFSARRTWLALVWVSARSPMKAHIIQARGNLH
jgi:hypothetical protein